jgi:hypothetical protein
MTDLVAVGKTAWDIVVASQSTMNEQTDFIGVVPKGAENELTGGGGVNHFDWEWKGPGIILHDFWFLMQLEWSYGARHKGGGAFMTRAVVRLLDWNIRISGYHVTIKCRTGPVENVGTDLAPVSMVPIDVSMTWNHGIGGMSGGTNRFRIRGDGAGHASYDDNSYEP